jgi:uncharacterized protein YukJ
MPLKNYSVLKGRPIAMRFGSGQSPHYQIHLVAGDANYRIAINVQSSDGSMVEYLVRSPFVHPITSDLQPLQEGLHPQPNQPNSIGLDYIRRNLMQPQEMTTLPVTAPGPDNDLNEKLDHFVQRAMSNENAWVYAFGETWGPEANKPDKYFGFRPGRGIHDIHMNQGNPMGRFSGDNGPRQDGGLVFEFPDQNQWGAVFLKFQTQSWHTDDTTGHPIPGTGDDGDPRIPPDHVPTDNKPDGLLRIVGALVNATRTPEKEVVTLLNTADRDIDLTGWKLANKQPNMTPLSGTLTAGGVLQVVVQKPMELSNKGGIISVLDNRGIKVHGVSYTRDQARTPGLTIAF